jgi:hypothetical protein
MPAILVCKCICCRSDGVDARPLTPGLEYLVSVVCLLGEGLNQAALVLSVHSQNTTAAALAAANCEEDELSYGMQAARPKQRRTHKPTAKMAAMSSSEQAFRWDMQWWRVVFASMYALVLQALSCSPSCTYRLNAMLSLVIIHHTQGGSGRRRWLPCRRCL